MANPQLENGYLQLANELWDEVIRRDFSKRQKDIIFLIWRLSYGCRKRKAIIPKLKNFELCGVPATQIKTELIYLESCKVLIWDPENKSFEINKNYELWQISPVRKWDKQSFDELLSLNLNRKKTSQNVMKSDEEIDHEDFTKHEVLHNNDSENFTNNEVATSQNMKLDFTKHEVEGVSNPCGSKAEEVSKYSIKDSIKDSSSTKIFYLNQGTEKQQEPQQDFSFSRIYQLYEKHFTTDGKVTDFEVDDLGHIFDDYGGEWVIEAMREAVRHKKQTLAYVNGVLEGFRKRGGTSRDLPNEQKNGNTPAYFKIDEDDPITKHMRKVEAMRAAPS